MSQYRTEILIPPDRYVCLQIPPDLPEGRATITITVQASGPSESGFLPEEDPDRQDIEWWEEFEDDREREAVVN